LPPMVSKKLFFFGGEGGKGTHVDSGEKEEKVGLEEPFEGNQLIRGGPIHHRNKGSTAYEHESGTSFIDIGRTEKVCPEGEKLRDVGEESMRSGGGEKPDVNGEFFWGG